MSDVMLHGVLNMPVELWSDCELDKAQRHSRYVQASKEIKRLSKCLEAANEKIEKLEDEVLDLKAMLETHE